jgi:hypothetical protein
MEHYITHTSSGLAMLDGIFIAGCVPPVIIAQDRKGGGRPRPLKRQSRGTFYLLWVMSCGCQPKALKTHRPAAYTVKKG